jgi:hypothetical protein
VRSFVLSTGSRLIGEDQLYISTALWRYSVTLQVLIFVSLIVLARVFSLSWSSVALILVLNIYSSLHLSMMLGAHSFSALRRTGPLINGYYNYFALSVVVLPWLPSYLKPIYVVLILLALIWPWIVAYRRWRKRRAALLREKEL